MIEQAILDRLPWESEAGPDYCVRGASPTGCSRSASRTQNPFFLAPHKLPAGSPVCINATILSRNPRLISGVYVATPSQLRESTPSLAHYGLLITRRGSEWHVDNLPSAFAL